MAVSTSGYKYGIAMGKPTTGGHYGDHLKDMNGIARRFNQQSVELYGQVTSLRRRKVKELPYMVGI